jgi:hypothetical protein
MIGFLIALYAGEKRLRSALRVHSLIDEDTKQNNAYLVEYGSEPRTVSQLLALSKEYKNAN